MLEYIEFVVPFAAQQYPLRPHLQQQPQPDGIVISKTWSEDTNSTCNEASKGHHEQEPRHHQRHEHPEDTTTTTSDTTDKEWSDESSSACDSSISSVTVSFGTEHDIFTVSSASASRSHDDDDDDDDSVFVWLAEHHQKQQRHFDDVFTNDDWQTSLSCPTILNEEDCDSNDDEDSSVLGLRQQYSLPTTTDNQ